MAGKNTAAFGIYRTREGAERGVDELLANGFRNEDISVLLPENRGTKDFAHEKQTKAPEGATAGTQGNIDESAESAEACRAGTHFSTETYRVAARTDGGPASGSAGRYGQRHRYSMAGRAFTQCVTVVRPAPQYAAPRRCSREPREHHTAE